MALRRSLLSSLLASSLAASPAVAAQSGCVAVVGDSDLHGILEPFVLKAHAPNNRRGAGARTALLRIGGVGSIAAYLQILRKFFGPRLVFVSAGDLYQGTLASNLSRGRAVVEAFSELGLAATAIGNHDFDYGAVTPDDPDVTGVLKRRAAGAGFAFLTLNVMDAATHRRVDWPGTRPSVLVDAGSRRDGLSVGIIGAAGTDTPKVTRPDLVAGLEFPEPIPLIVAEARQLRAQGAELIVLTAHFGGSCDDLSDPNDISSCDPESELFRVLQALPEGTVDVAIGGHTHSHVRHWVNGTLAMQAGARGRYLALAEVCTMPRGGIDRARTTLYPPVQLCLDEWRDGGCDEREPGEALPPTRPAQFLGEMVAVPETITKVIEPYLAAARAAVNEPVEVDLPHPLLKDDGGVWLGNLVAEAMREAAGSDFAVQNLGGVRTGLPAGPLTYGQVFEVLPFGNQIGVLTVSGAQVKGFVQQLILRRGKPPFLAGLTAATNGDGFIIEKTDGSSLDDEARYTLATSDFLIAGGEGLDVIIATVPPTDQKILPTTLRDSVLALLRKRYPLTTDTAGASER